MMKLQVVGGRGEGGDRRGEACPSSKGDPGVGVRREAERRGERAEGAGQGGGQVPQGARRGDAGAGGGRV